MTDDEIAQMEAKSSGGGLTDEQIADLEDPELAFLQKGHKRQPEHPFKFQNTGPISEVRRQLDPKQIHVSRLENGMGTSGVTNSGVDRWSLGTWGALNRLAGRIPGPIGEPSREAVADMEAYRREHPIASSWTDGPAYMLDGPITALTSTIAKPVQKGAEWLASKGLGPLQARLAATAATGAGVGGAASGLEALSEGEAPEDILRRTGEGATTGALVSGGLGLGASLMKPAADLVLGSRGAQARKFITDRGGTVTPGKVELPPGEYATTGASDEDIGIQGAASAEKAVKMLNEEKKGALRAVGSKIGRIEQSPEAGQLHDVSDVVSNMRIASRELDTSPQAKAALQGLLDDITAKQPAAFNPDTDAYQLTASDVNKLRRQLDRFAKTGTSNDASLSPLKKAANQVRDLTQSGPFAEANQEYSKESKRYQKSRRLLGLSEHPKTADEAASPIAKVANRAIRRGQNSVTAGKERADAEAFAARHPDIGLELDKPELLRKKADISFGILPTHGGLMERMTHGHHNLALALGLGSGSLTGVVPALALRNMQAIQGRWLAPLAEETQLAEPFLLNAIPTYAAARAAHGDE